MFFFAFNFFLRICLHIWFCVEILYPKSNVFMIGIEFPKHLAEKIVTNEWKVKNNYIFFFTQSFFWKNETILKSHFALKIFFKTEHCIFLLFIFFSLFFFSGTFINSGFKVSKFIFRIIFTYFHPITIFWEVENLLSVFKYAIYST